MTDVPPGNTPEPRRKGPLKKLGAGVARLTKAKQKFPMPNPESGLKVVIATDAWKPQMNGVVTTLDTLGNILEGFGNQVTYITPLDFKSIPMPTYPEIQLAIGLVRRRLTTSFHTRFAEYTHERFKIPVDWGYALLKDFHKYGETLMVATPGLMEELEERGFQNMKLWSRGVDTAIFKPTPSDIFDRLPRPIFTYVGRIAVEKSIEDFLELDLPGSKVVVGAGPQEEELKAKYTDIFWAGPQFGEDLVRHYSASDVFVFPSRTDTFGLVNVEALACGVPVAAYPVRGPLEIMEKAPAGAGAMDEDLRKACLTALENRDAEECREHSKLCSWEAGARQFMANLEIPGFDEEFWLRSAKMIEDPFLP